MSNDTTQKFLEALQSDLKNLSLESRKKYAFVKESSEEAIIKVKNASTNPQALLYHLTNQILYPLVQGCESKDLKIVRMCISTIQRLITQQVVDQKGALYITDTLWMLMESGMEEVKVLQTVTLLLTINSVAQGDVLAKNLVMCFRLYFVKDTTITNTAGATIRQLVSLVFERAVTEDEEFPGPNLVQKETNFEELKTPSNTPPKGLRSCAADAFLMFQDLIQLVNADHPFWLNGMTEMTRTFGLELLESVLSSFPSVFFNHPEFSFLLKERVCALVIKLFSPNIKYRSNMPPTSQQTATLDKPYFPISMRLLRVVSILVQKYYILLITECEIFLSLIVKFLDPDKPTWQRALALEVVHKMTVQSELLKSFCECYDMKPHATNIFQDIVNSLGAYVQSLFVNPQLAGQATATGTSVTTQGQPPAILGGMAVGPGISPQPGFFYRGVWLPIVVSFTGGQAKPIYLEFLDKMDPPAVPEGYGISIAFACLMDIIRSTAITIEGIWPGTTDQQQQQPAARAYSPLPEERELHAQFIQSSWCGLLAALSLLLEASTDESVSETILKALQTCTSLCGLLDLGTPRDAFITAVCKASLPPHYALTILNPTPIQGTNNHKGLSQDMNRTEQFGQVQQNNEMEFGQHIVVVGNALPTASLPAGAQQRPVMLTSKNLQCMRTLLSIAHCHGSILGTAWHLELTTLQHLVWILDLKPSTGGSLKANRSSADTNAVITNAVIADLPVLSVMLSRLFESSRYLDDVALHHLIDALCKLSHEAMEMAYSNREPSLFAVAKLLETGVVNLMRVEVLWRPVTNHLLEVCQHPHIRMREWGVEAITYLVKTALQFKYEKPLKENQKLQILLLGPLVELSTIHHPDVRQRQLDCVLHVLHNSGESLTHGWPLLLNIIGAISDSQGENLVRLAFQCLQLVVTDFLPVMPWHCLPVCVDTAAKFGSQTQEMNISLTAVGLMWNISDYFFQNQEKLTQSLTTSEHQVFLDVPGMPDMNAFDKMWMCLYSRLGDLCVDSRPAVRKSAGQTLFSTISAHGCLLQNNTWQAVVWQVLFPLLDRVRSSSDSASNQKVDMEGNLLIHHSRNTAQKQWAETQVLTLSGVARVFNTKCKLLETLKDFPRAWAILTDFIENGALNKNNEVSLAALKAFQEILYVGNTGKRAQDPTNQSSPSNTSATSSMDVTNSIENVMNDTTDIQGQDRTSSVWNVAWKVWYSIGMETTCSPKPGTKPEAIYVPSQPFLTALIQIFPSLFHHLKERFVTSDLQKLCLILQNCISVPIQGEASIFILPTLSEVILTSLQEHVLLCLDMLQNEALNGSESTTFMIPSIFNQLLQFSKCSCKAPSYGELEVKSGNQISEPADWVTLNYVPFGERALTMAVALYKKTCSYPIVIESHVLECIVKSLRVPLKLKYGCLSKTTWKLAVTSLLQVMQEGLPLARKHTGSFEGFWTELAAALNEFLFPTKLPTNQTLEESHADETIDCQVIELIRSEVLPHSTILPKDFLLQVMVLLNQGSIHSATTHEQHPMDHSSLPPKLREDFAKTCFETLLQFSLCDNMNVGNVLGECRVGSDKKDATNKLAVTSLLHRFQQVLINYVDDERLSGKCPLPRHRMSEISFVLKAVATLIASLKKAPEKVDVRTWNQLIDLYPHLVNCTTVSSQQVTRSLQEALHEYQELLQPPKSIQNGIEK